MRSNARLRELAKRLNVREMAIRKIAEIGHPILRVRARPVSAAELATASVQRLIDDLVETMRDANGAGLAATQIYEPLRICVVEVTENPRYPHKPEIPLTIAVNPVIECLGPETFDNYEGCLSVPNLRGVVARIAEIRLSAVDREGRPFEQLHRGFSAGTFQHEVDHLDGRVFVDRVSDPTTFTTWTQFERHHAAAFYARAEEINARYHRGAVVPPPHKSTS